MRFLIFLISAITLLPACHRKELPSTKLRKEMRSAAQKNQRDQKKLLKRNKKSLGKKKKK